MTSFYLSLKKSFTSSQPSSSFGGTFGSKTSFGKEASFLGDQESQIASQGDFGEMLSQQQGGNDDDQQDLEENDDFGTGVFTNAEQVNGKSISILDSPGKSFGLKNIRLIPIFFYFFFLSPHSTYRRRRRDEHLFNQGQIVR